MLAHLLLHLRQVTGTFPLLLHSLPIPIITTYLPAWLWLSSGASGGTGPAFSPAQEVGPRQSPCCLQSPPPTQLGLLLSEKDT